MGKCVRVASSHIPISLVIPAFNEVNGIQKTIDDARNYLDGEAIPFEIIVSADGTDGTRELIQELSQSDSRLKVIGHRERRGKGFAVRTAVAMAQHPIVGFIDADNKTPFYEFHKFYPRLCAGAEMIIGSRALSGSKIERRQPFYRRMGTKVFRVILSSIIGLRDVPDTQCGFKFFQTRLARLLFEHQTIDGYMFDVEILYLAVKAGIRIEQIPIVWRDDGDSRLNLVAGNIRNLVDIMKLRLSVHRRMNFEKPISDSVVNFK